MRRLLAICSAVGLLCGALGCHWDCGGCIHGRCDCENGPLYGCPCELSGHGHVLATAPFPAPAPPAPVAEPLKVMPKDIAPKPGELKEEDQ
jgi:hypothetical protein